MLTQKKHPSKKRRIIRTYTLEDHVSPGALEKKNI